MEKDLALMNELELGIYPWRRYFARAVDLCLLSCLFTLFRLEMPLISEYRDYVTELGYAFKTLLYYIANIVLIGFIGTTPGKALLNIHLVDNEHSNLNWLKVIKREFMVWVFGYGLNIPIVSLITLIRSYNNLEDTGTTRWDRELNFSVYHGKLDSWRYVVCVAIFMLASTLAIWIHR